MGALSLVIKEIVYSDDEEKRTPMEARFIQLVRAVARDEADRPVKVVPPSELPANAPAYSLWRKTDSTDLYMGNGPNQPLSRYIPAP